MWRQQSIISIIVLSVLASSHAIAAPAPACPSPAVTMPAAAWAGSDQASEFGGVYLSFATPPPAMSSPALPSDPHRLRMVEAMNCDPYVRAANNNWSVFKKCAISVGIIATTISITCPLTAPATQAAGCSAALACYNSYNTQMSALDAQYPGCSDTTQFTICGFSMPCD